MSADKRFLPVGILGGMGPEATVLLMSRILQATDAQDDSDHIPLLVDHNPQVPSRIKALIEGVGENPGPTLASMAKRLESAGAQALAMPCNTAHAYSSYIRDAVSIPFLNMIELTAKQIGAMALNSRKVGMLASPAVEMAGVFDMAFENQRLTPIYTDHPDSLLDAIKRLKRDGKDTKARAIQRAIAQELLEKNCDLLLVACTELSLITDALPSNSVFRDSLDILVEEICRFSLQQPMR